MTAAEKKAINPMFDPDGGTFRVSSALNVLAFFFEELNDGIKLDGAQTYGVAVLLNTCAAALREMA